MICYGILTNFCFLHLAFSTSVFLLCSDFKNRAEIVHSFSMCHLCFRYCTRHGELKDGYDISIVNMFTATLDVRAIIKLIYKDFYLAGNKSDPIPYMRHCSKIIPHVVIFHLHYKAIEEVLSSSFQRRKK